MGLINYADALLGGSSSEPDTVDANHILHALKSIESGGDYGISNRQGSGAYGAYQIMPGSWVDWSRELFGKVVPKTEDNQDAIAQFKVKQLLEEGKSPRQIASVWYSGKPDYFGKRGSWRGIPYNVASYVEKFQNAFDKLSSLFAPDSAEAAEMDYSKALIAGQDGGDTSPKPKTSKTNYADMLIKGNSPKIQAPTESQQQSEAMPGEPAASSHRPSSFYARTKAAFADKPETMIDTMGEERFPNLSIEARRQRYFIKDGTLYYLDTKPGSNVLEAFPENGEGLSEKMKSLAAGVVGKGFPAIGGAVGFATGGVPGMLAGTAGGEALRQGVAQYALGEQKTWPDVAAEIGKEEVGALLGLGAGKVINPGLNALGRMGSGRLGRLAAQDYRVLSPTEMQRLFDLGQRYGIPLTVPEATGSPTLINAFNLASTSPYQVAERIMQWAETQRVPQIKEAISRELNAIFPNESIFEAGRMGQQAATDALGVLKDSRKAISKPYYDASFESGAKVDIQPVLDKVAELQAMAPRGWKVDNLLTRIKKGLTIEKEILPDSQMPGRQEMQGIIRDVYANIDQVRKVGISTASIRADYGPEGVRAINRAIPGVIRKSGQPLDQVAADYGFDSADSLYSALTDYQPRYKMMALAEKQRATKEIVPVDDIRTLHGAKLEIDSLLKGPEAEGLPNDIKRQLMQIKDSLVTQMEVASPEYAEGMAAFRRGSKLINDFMYGKENVNPSNFPALSTLGRIVKKKQGEMVEDVPEMLFGKGSSPAIVGQAKRFLEAQDPDAWKALVRAHLQDRLETAVKNSQGWGYGYKFKETVFGTPRQQAILKTALTDPITGDLSAFNKFSDFMDLLDVTNRIVYRNSRTTPLAITEKAVRRESGGIKSRVADLLGTRINATKFAEFNRDLATPEYLNKVLDAMMDPGTANELARIRQLSNPQKKAIEVVSILGAMTGENFLDAELSNRELYPERAPKGMQ